MEKIISSKSNDGVTTTLFEVVGSKNPYRVRMRDDDSWEMVPIINMYADIETAKKIFRQM